MTHIHYDSFFLSTIYYILVYYGSYYSWVIITYHDTAMNGNSPDLSFAGQRIALTEEKSERFTHEPERDATYDVRWCIKCITQIFVRISRDKQMRFCL